MAIDNSLLLDRTTMSHYTVFPTVLFAQYLVIYWNYYIDML